MLDSAQLDNSEFLVPGLIDFHTHVFEHHGYQEFNLNPDKVGVNCGTSTVVDQGGAGALTLGSFKHNIVNTSKTHVQCFVSAYLCGGNPRGELKALYSPAGMNVEKTVTAVRHYDPDLSFVRGVKVHSGPSGYDEWGIEPLRIAREIGNQLRLPLYLHLGSLWNFENTSEDAEKILDQVLNVLQPGDILAHPYRPENGFVNIDGRIHSMVPSLKEKGILVDVGRGTKVSYKNIRILLESGFEPDIISSDLHGFGWPEQYQHSLLGAMSEMLHFGMPLDRIVQAVTTLPKTYLKGCPAAVTKLKVINKPTTFTDFQGETIVVKNIFEFVQNL